MFTMDDVTGSLDYGEDSTHVVTLWYIPGGWDTSKAQAINVFFPDESIAQSFCDRWSAPPQMASIYVVQGYDLACVNAANRNYKD